MFIFESIFCPFVLNNLTNIKLGGISRLNFAYNGTNHKNLKYVVVRVLLTSPLNIEP